MKTKRFLLTITFILAICSINFAQEKTERRIIEVTGSAEKLITPNEFTFKITLVERIENKQKITIETQESKLKDELSKLGVDVQKDLTVFDIDSFYVYQKKLKDTLGSKEYRLKINDLEKIEKLQQIADRINVVRLDLIESTHSEITTFRKETKMEAIKAAKTKAEYMLAAIGERVGKPVFIQEIEEETPRSSYGAMSNGRSNISLNAISGGSPDSDTTLSFSKIKLRYMVLARFEIQ